MKPFKDIPACELADAWLPLLQDQFQQPYMRELEAFLVSEKVAGKSIFPAEVDWFKALNTTLPDQVKLVVLGQDPYHGAGQAHGLSFSVPAGVRIPPSLRNMVKEIAEDLALPIPANGCLQGWAEQGVLLLNATLTVEEGCAGSHQKKGWEQFTDDIIQQLSERYQGLVFLLWGSYAQNKGQWIDSNKHLVLKAPHPSPLSAHRGFFGCRHFSQANAYLSEQGREPIDWRVG